MTAFTILTREAVSTAGAFCTLERCTTDGQPPTLIAKTPRDGPVNDVGTALGLYAREARFYAELADTVPMRAPRCYDPGDGVTQPLLLEDLSSLRAGDQIAGLTLEQAQMILRDVAALHAQHWETATQDWLFELDDPVNVQMLRQVTAGGLPTLRERFSRRFGAAVLDNAAEVCDHIADVLHACSHGPRTIAHGDLRLDNLLFDGNETVYLDWQTVAHTRGTHDVAYLLSGSIDSETLSRSWEDLLRGYHQTLTAAGVEYPWPNCLADYRQNVLYSFVPALATLGAVSVEGDRGADLADTIGERILRHAAEVDAFATLT
jgi:hypothetical protein